MSTFAVWVQQFVHNYYTCTGLCIGWVFEEECSEMWHHQHIVRQPCLRIPNIFDVICVIWNWIEGYVPTCVYMARLFLDCAHIAGDVPTCVLMARLFVECEHNAGDVPTCVYMARLFLACVHVAGDVPTCVYMAKFFARVAWSTLLSLAVFFCSVPCGNRASSITRIQMQIERRHYVNIRCLSATTRSQLLYMYRLCIGWVFEEECSEIWHHQLFVNRASEFRTYSM